MESFDPVRYGGQPRAWGGGSWNDSSRLLESLLLPIYSTGTLEVSASLLYWPLPFLGLFLCLGGEEAVVPCDASPVPALVSAAPVSALFQGVLAVV